MTLPSPRPSILTTLTTTLISIKVKPCISPIKHTADALSSHIDGIVNEGSLMQNCFLNSATCRFGECYCAGGSPLLLLPTRPPPVEPVGGVPPLFIQPNQLPRFAFLAAASSSAASCTKRRGRGFEPA